MVISLSEEINALIVRVFVPLMAHYYKNEHNVDTDLEHLSNFLGASTPMPNYTKGIIDKCAHISNKGKCCPRKAVNGKFYCSNHSDKDKKKAPRKTTKKDIDKPILKDSDIYQNQITCRLLHSDNPNILIDHKCSLVLYTNEIEGFSHVIIGIYDPPKYFSDDDLLSRKLEYIRELTQNEIELYENSHKLAYKYREYIDIIKENAVNYEVENNKILKEEPKKRGRKAKTEKEELDNTSDKPADKPIGKTIDKNSNNIDKVAAKNLQENIKKNDIPNIVKNISFKTKVKDTALPTINCID